MKDATLNNGTPTAPDVRLLEGEWPASVLTEGAVMARPEIAEVLKVPFRSNRYMTVESAFRRKMYREHNIALGVEGDKMTVLDPEERVEYAGRRQRSGTRIIKRSGNLTYRTDLKRLPKDQRKLADHQIAYASAIYAMQRSRSKEISPPEKDRKEA